MRQSLKNKSGWIIGTVVLLSSFSLIVGVWFLHSTAEERLLNEKKDNLIALRNSVFEGLTAWRKQQQEHASILAADPKIRDAAIKLLKAEPNRNALVNHPSQHRLRALLHNVIQTKEYRGYFLVGKDLMNYGSTRDSNLGVPSLLTNQRGFLDQIWSGESALSHPQPSDVPLLNADGELSAKYPTMFVGAPLQNALGEIVAILAFRIDPFGDYSRIFQASQTADTGETYAFDKEGMLLSPTRFKRDLIAAHLLEKGGYALGSLKISDPGVSIYSTSPSTTRLTNPPLTKMVRHATDGATGFDMTGYRDYRGVPVVGAWLWDEKFQIGIAAEMDLSEARRTIEYLEGVATLTTIVTQILLLLVGLFFLQWQKKKLDQMERAREEEVEQKTSRYRKAIEIAQQELSLKSRVLANVTHELRTPLNGIIGMNQILSDTKLNENQRDLVQTGSDCAHSLLRVINDILELSKLETGSYTMTPQLFELAPLVHNLEPLFLQDIREGKLAFTIDIDPLVPERVIGDPARLQQILVNLIGNAIKFTNEGGSIHLKICSKRTDGVQTILSFEVVDTGVGIDKADLERIFNPFEQVESIRTEDNGGTGLGLAICRELVAQMGGSITASSTPGVQTIFSFTACFDLPESPAAREHSSRDVTDADEAHSLSILVAEDNKQNQEYIVRVLENEGHRVTVAENGVEALELLDTGSFDAIFMDIRMPVMDGFEAALIIRKSEDPRGKRIPIIATTAYATIADRERFIAAGMDDLLPKPFCIKDIKCLIQNLYH